LPILNGNSNEEGRILFGGVKHLEKKFIFKGEELTINKPSFMHHRESYKGTVFNVISKLSIGDKTIGAVYSATLNAIAGKDLLGLPNGTVTTVDRLYAFFNDVYAEYIGVLFAYYHVKRMGLAISKFTYEFNTGMY
uniref:hypothetical protein n=1 Tax=Caldivirga sp. UBA161 TaxID=1915569 RepID=UPI0025B8145A